MIPCCLRGDMRILWALNALRRPVKIPYFNHTHLETRMTPYTELVTDASAWKPEDLERDQSWKFELNDTHRNELAEALKQVNDRDLHFAIIKKEDFPLPALANTLKEILHELRDGRGFAFLSGMPTDEYEYADLEKLYWGMCTHLGIAVTQNSEAGLIHYITDGELRPQGGARILGKPGIVKLHVDLSDCAGLFCVRQAPDDPPSLVASSMTVYNEILRQHPEYLPRLYEGFPWDRKGPYPNEEPPSSYFNIPAYSAADGVVTCRFHPGWIRAGMGAVGQSLTEEETEMFDFIAEVSLANSFEYGFHKGDIAWVNNYTVFHGRAAFKPVEEESERRLLLRLWLDLPDVRPFSDEGRVRYGAVRHGKMGWTADEILAGKHLEPHPRREDGVPEVS